MGGCVSLYGFRGKSARRMAIWPCHTIGGVRMTFSRDDPRPRVSARVDEQLKDELENYAKKEGKNMSEVVRNAISNEVQGVPSVDDSDVVPPAENELRQAWLILNQITGPNWTIESESALSILAQKLGKPRPLVRDHIIKPLSDRGYLSVLPRLESVLYRLEVRLE